MTTLPGTPNPEAPNPQMPIVQRLRIRHTKRGRLRFTSHRDFGRAFERALRRAEIPLAFSSGFSPHPKISYGGAAPTGAASEAEYLEIGLQREVDPDWVRKELDAALPAGLDVLEVVVATPDSLADLLKASHWELLLTDVGVEAAATAVRTFIAAEAIEVERMTKKGIRRFDCRSAVLTLEARANEPDVPDCAILKMVVRHGTPSVRPDDVLAGLRVTGGLELAATPLANRVAQGPIDPGTGTVGDPFAHDRDVSA